MTAGEFRASEGRVLLVDDHEQGRKALARLLEVAGFDVTGVKDASSAFEALRGPRGFDFVLTDLNLPDFDGREVVHRAQQLDPKPRVYLITGWDISAEETMRIGVEWVFLKPIDLSDMLMRLRAPSGSSEAESS